MVGDGGLVQRAAELPGRGGIDLQAGEARQVVALERALDRAAVQRCRHQAPGPVGGVHLTIGRDRGVAAVYNAEQSGKLARQLLAQGRRGLCIEQPGEQRPAEVAVADLIAEDAIEGAPRDRHRAARAQLLEQRHRDGLAQAEDAHAGAQDAVLQRLALVDSQAELPAVEQQGPCRAAGRNDDLVAKPSVQELILRDAQARQDQIRRGPKLRQPQSQVLRNRGRAVLRRDAALPLFDYERGSRRAARANGVRSHKAILTYVGGTGTALGGDGFADRAGAGTALGGGGFTDEAGAGTALGGGGAGTLVGGGGFTDGAGVGTALGGGGAGTLVGGGGFTDGAAMGTALGGGGFTDEVGAGTLVGGGGFTDTCGAGTLVGGGGFTDTCGAVFLASAGESVAVRTKGAASAKCPRVRDASRFAFFIVSVYERTDQHGEKKKWAFCDPCG